MRRIAWSRVLGLVLAAAAVGGLAVAVVAMGWIGVDGVRAQFSGVSGSVSADECTWVTGTDSGWACSGEFESDDGTVRIASIEIDEHLSERPVEPVPARVSGGSALFAITGQSQGHWVSLFGSVVLGALAAFGIVGLVLLVSVWPPWLPASEIGTGTRPVEASGAPPSGPLPRNRVMVVVLVWYGLLTLVTGSLILTVAPIRSQVSPADIVTAEVVATRLADDTPEIDVEWTDRTGQEFELGPGSPGRNTWVAAIVLAPTAGLWWAWTWRLVRWARGRRRPPQPVTVSVLVGTPSTGGPDGGPTSAALWLRSRDSEGATWYQRAIWNRRLLAFAVRAHDSLAEHGARVDVPNASARRCPGAKNMFLIDIPDVGRIWPASRAMRSGMPFAIHLDPLGPRRLGEKPHGSGRLILIPAGIGIVALAWGIAGPAAAVSLPVIFGGWWLWLGATPWNGVYAPQAVPRRRL